jgi:hypothetical protein
MDPLVGAVKKSKHCNGYAAVELEELVIVIVVAAATIRFCLRISRRASRCFLSRLR